MNAEISDNILYFTTIPQLIEYTNTGSVMGLNNWLQSSADASHLSGSVKGTLPGFRNAAANDYTLAPGSLCIGAAGPAMLRFAGQGILS